MHKLLEMSFQQTMKLYVKLLDLKVLIFPTKTYYFKINTAMQLALVKGC